MLNLPLKSVGQGGGCTQPMGAMVVSGMALLYMHMAFHSPYGTYRDVHTNKQ